MHSSFFGDGQRNNGIDGQRLGDDNLAHDGIREFPRGAWIRRSVGCNAARNGSSTGSVEKAFSEWDLSGRDYRIAHLDLFLWRQLAEGNDESERHSCRNV